jgi:predicted dehydrogenase
MSCAKATFTRYEGSFPRNKWQEHKRDKKHKPKAAQLVLFVLLVFLSPPMADQLQSHSPLGVAIIGCGLVGAKRARSLGEARLAACVDRSIEKAKSLAATGNGVVAETDWRRVLARSDIDIVIVATTNDALAEITAESIRAGKHVLVEKPAARNTRELEVVILAAGQSQSVVRVGFNHRYHPALQKARRLLDDGAAGELMFIRARYGHGGRSGYDREWRADPSVSGGGELIDQGVHLIDLSRWFLGDFERVTGLARTYYWDMPVDDNAFVLLQTRDGKASFFHCSCTEWKNLFSLEIYGKTGKIHVEGLGGSYGTEMLSYFKMGPEMGPPEVTVWEYPTIDNSWNVEFSEFLEDIRLQRTPSPGLGDAHAALRIVERIYWDSGYDHRS